MHQMKFRDFGQFLMKAPIRRVNLIADIPGYAIFGWTLLIILGVFPDIPRFWFFFSASLILFLYAFMGYLAVIRKEIPGPSKNVIEGKLAQTIGWCQMIGCLVMGILALAIALCRDFLF